MLRPSAAADRPTIALCRRLNEAGISPSEEMMIAGFVEAGIDRDEARAFFDGGVPAVLRLRYEREGMSPEYARWVVEQARALARADDVEGYADARD